MAKLHGLEMGVILTTCSLGPEPIVINGVINPINGLKKWVTGVISPINGVMGPYL